MDQLQLSVASGQVVHSTRRAVLDALRSAGQATIVELAEMIGAKPISLRHHLTSLQAEGLVTAEERRQTVGRPANVYRLTEQAESLFPQKYYQLVERLLDQVKQSFPPHTVQMLIRSLAESLAEELRREFDQLSDEERQRRLIEVLAREGLMARWKQSEDGLELVEYHCPYYAVGQRHPEICQIDEVLIRVALNAGVAKEACLLSGDPACKFVITDGKLAHTSA